MRRKIDQLINMRTWAVAGASHNPDKYGHKIFVRLRELGYRVYPINPREAAIEGIEAYPAVGDLPETPDVVDLVVPPPATPAIVKACAMRGVKGVWFQPGSESEEAIRLAEEAGLIVVAGGPCAMIEAAAAIEPPAGGSGEVPPRPTHTSAAAAIEPPAGGAGAVPPRTSAAAAIEPPADGSGEVPPRPTHLKGRRWV